MAKTYIPNDPLFAQQWHLLNNGQDIMGRPQDPNAYRNDINVTGVWPDYTGEGVVVAVMDNGFQASHPDLAPNYLAEKSYYLTKNTPGQIDGDHGTATMGLIIGADNTIGGVGVAFGAQGIGYTTDGAVARSGLAEIDNFTTDFIKAVPRMLADGVDVMSNSWGMPLRPKPFQDAAKQGLYDAALTSLVSQGRDGLGTVVLFAAGNDTTISNQLKHNTNFAPTTSLPGAIVIGAATASGQATDYSIPGASVLVAAPGSGSKTQPSNPDAYTAPSIVTTDLLGTAGLNKTPDGDYTNLFDPATSSAGFTGTSAATPIAAGVVALMLQANPDLGYRDVQEILAYSAKAPASAADWHTNGATDWNGGGHLYDDHLGFGHIDALAAVRLAETWHKQSTYDNAVTSKQSLSGDASALILAAGESRDITVRFDDVIRVQHALLSINAAVFGGDPISSLADVTISLTGPDGKTKDVFMDPSYYDFMQIDGPLNFTFDTVHHWGELSNAGLWTVSIKNSSDAQLAIYSDLTLLGDKPSAGQTFIYTDDYARLGGSEAGRAVLSAEGINAINAAAVTSDTSIDLSSHLAHIAGVYTTLDPASLFGTLITGDGNDSLVGDASDNLFISGRGINSIVGGGGVDTLQLLKGIADYSQVQWGNDILLAGSASNDAVQGIAKFVFADGTLTLGTNVLVNDVFYATANRDVLASGIDTDTHYDLYGWKEGRDPNAWFSTVSYLANHADVRAAHVNPLTYYNDVGWKNGDDPSAWFDTTLYLKLNPDVAAAGVDPLAHFLAYGEAEGREVRPVVDSSHLINGAFDPTFYKLANPDVALSGMDAFAHWLQYGMAEGRNPDAYFDTSFYLAHNPDVAAAGVDPLQHYLNYGWKEGRDPSSAFDTEGYLAAYADVKESGMDPLVHYLQFGIAEGRHATWDLA
ncbi:S8 family serine peptidase [Xanthobacter sp. VNH20]|uniref:S8 family serine peptidase n=1 Tax=Xanthobacter sp. VNH20 TaxID=3156616 RepID=UPI0032B4D0D3